VGCENWKRFVLVTDDEVELPLAHLQSLDDPSVALIVTSPTQVDPNYSARLTDQDRADLGLSDGVQPVLYCTLTVSSDGWLTANLLGPLALNPASRQGKQLVLNESAYSSTHKVAKVAEVEDGALCSS
jgi:flagellar assembly factor FliW